MPQDPTPHVICEFVVVRGELRDFPEHKLEQLVQHEDLAEDHGIKKKTIAAIKAAGYSIDRSWHPVVGIGDDPAVSWLDLADIINVTVPMN